MADGIDDPNLLDDPADDAPDDQIDDIPDDDQIDDIPDDPDAPDGDQPQDRQDPPQRQPSRAQQRIETLAREAREARAEAQRAREEIEAFRRAQAQPQETPAQRAERLAMMDPDQRTDYLLAERDRRENERYARLEFQMQDSADRTAFEGLCARKPVAAKLKDQVEERLAEMRRNGTTAPRETVLKWVIGDRALANEPGARTRAKNYADANRQRQQARPTGSRDDAGAPSGRASNEKEARRKRLEDMEL
jgi:hypothetical protein